MQHPASAKAIQTINAGFMSGTRRGASLDETYCFVVFSSLTNFWLERLQFGCILTARVQKFSLVQALTILRSEFIRASGIVKSIRRAQELFL